MAAMAAAAAPARSAPVLLSVSLTGLRRLRGLESGSFSSAREGQPGLPFGTPARTAARWLPGQLTLEPSKGRSPQTRAGWVGGRGTAQARGKAEQPIIARAGPSAPPQLQVWGYGPAARPLQNSLELCKVRSSS